jgi:hypothetical protein
MISQDVTLGGWELKQPEAQSSTVNKILLADNQELFRIGVDPTFLSPGAICLQLARFNGMLQSGPVSVPC